MTGNIRLRQLFVWSAIFAVLVASLVPPITRAVYRQTIPALELLEVCTFGGLRLISAASFENEQLPNSQTSQNSGSHHNEHFEHCSFCVTQACSFGLAPVEAAVLLPLVAAQGHDLPSYAAPHIEFGWQPNQARAPPVFL